MLGGVSGRHDAPAWMRGVVALALAMALVAMQAMASGEEGREAVRLVYASDPGCPDRASFEARVLARTTRASFDGSGDGRRTFEVTLQAGARPSGRLTVLRDGVVEGAREVGAETCLDVAEVLALGAALAIDPALVAGPAPPSAPTAPPPPATPTPAPPSVSMPASAPAPASAPVPPASGAPESTLQAKSSLPHTFWLGEGVAVAAGVTPITLVAVAPAVGWRTTRASVWSPSVTLSFLRASTGTLAVTGGEASFTWTVGRADGCLLSWPAGSPARLLACARVEAGTLDAAGSQVPSARSSTRAWVTVGPLVRGEWELLAPLFLAAEGAVLVHVIDDRFYFQPGDTTVFAVPLAGAEAAAILGVHFL
jgi:hypothetical protein